MPIQDTLVLTPTLGKRETLKNAITSVRRIGGTRVKHILVGPSVSLLYWQKIYPWIEICDQPKEQKGVYAALNYGLFKHGMAFKYFAYINDDDYWLDDFRFLFLCMDKSNKIEGCYGRVIYTANRRPVKKGPYFPFASFYVPLHRLGVPLFTQQSLILKTTLLLSHNGFNESKPLSADSDLWARIVSSNARLEGVNRFCSCYEFEGDRLSLDPQLQHVDTKFNNTSRGLRFFIDFCFLLIYRLFNIPLYLSRLL